MESGTTCGGLLFSALAGRELLRLVAAGAESILIEADVTADDDTEASETEGAGAIAPVGLLAALEARGCDSSCRWPCLLRCAALSSCASDTLTLEAVTGRALATFPPRPRRGRPPLSPSLFSGLDSADTEAEDRSAEVCPPCPCPLPPEVADPLRLVSFKASKATTETEASAVEGVMEAFDVPETAVAVTADTGESVAAAEAAAAEAWLTSFTSFPPRPRPRCPLPPASPPGFLR